MRGRTSTWRRCTRSWEASAPKHQCGHPSALVLPRGCLLFSHRLILPLASSGARIFAHCLILVRNANYVGQIHVFAAQRH